MKWLKLILKKKATTKNISLASKDSSTSTLQAPHYNITSSLMAPKANITNSLLALELKKVASARPNGQGKNIFFD